MASSATPSDDGNLPRCAGRHFATDFVPGMGKWKPPPEIAGLADRRPGYLTQGQQWLSRNANRLLFALVGLAVIAFGVLQYDAIRVIDGDTVRHRLRHATSFRHAGPTLCPVKCDHPHRLFVFAHDEALNDRIKVGFFLVRLSVGAA